MISALEASRIGASIDAVEPSNNYPSIAGADLKWASANEEAVALTSSEMDRCTCGLM